MWVTESLTGWVPSLRFYDSLVNFPCGHRRLDADALPGDIEALKAALIQARAGRAASEARTVEVEAEFAIAKAVNSDGQALILHLQLEIEKQVGFGIVAIQ